MKFWKRDRKLMAEFHKQDMQQLINNHLDWLYTRRFYAPPAQVNILARLQIDRRRSKEPPNARNDSMCAAYNLVVEDAALNDKALFKAYFFVYYKDFRINPQTGKPTLLKTIADELGIEPCSVYDRAHVAAAKYYNTTIMLNDLHGKLQREVEDFID